MRVDLSCWSILNGFPSPVSLSKLIVPIQKRTPIFSSYEQICYGYEQKEGGSLVVVIESAMKVIIYRVVSSFSSFLPLLLFNTTIVRCFTTSNVEKHRTFEIWFKRFAPLFTTFYSFPSLTKLGLEIKIVRSVTNQISLQRNGNARMMQFFLIPASHLSLTALVQC